MSLGKALYFPYIHFQDETWLKYSLLYWDAVKRIVPRHYRPRDSDDVAAFAKEGLIEDVDPQSGDKPYVLAAADEFIPTVNELIQARNGKIGAGISVAGSAKANTPDAVVHLEKMDVRVQRVLTDSGLAKVSEDWMKMPENLAGYYMLCLAAHIGERQNAPLLSDSFEMETGGTYFQHSRISPSTKLQDGGVGFCLARMVLPVPRPASLSNVSTRQLVEFHRKFETERMQFRAAIEAVTQNAAGLTDPTAIRDFLEQEKKVIGNALRDQRKTLKEFRVGVVDSLLAVSVPSVVTSAVTGLSPIAVAIGSGVGLALSMISWYMKARSEKRKTIRDCDWHYLLRLQENFKPEYVAGTGQPSFEQFAVD